MRTFLRDTKGNIAAVFAITLVPAIMAVGAATDLARFNVSRAELQSVADRAVLAAVKVTESETAARDAAERMIRSSLPHPYSLDAFEWDNDEGWAEITISSEVDTTFMGIAGIPAVTVAATAQAKVAQQNIELVLVLDNSGSMSGSRISSLREAASDLVDTVFAIPNAGVKAGVVPFAAMVNVGSANATATWLDRNGGSPIPADISHRATTGRQVYRDLGVSWAGWVDARPRPHDVGDTTPVATDPSTLFVPSLSPDDPDPSNWYEVWLGTYRNSYLGDNGGSCSGTVGTTLERARRACKYENVRLSSGAGPNNGCTTVSVQPMVSQKAVVKAKIASMGANGGTNIAEGMAWGWRVISPEAPFTEGAAYDDLDYRKVIVLMTDGENTWNGSSGSVNRSDYSAYGYSRTARLGTDSTNSGTLGNAIDDRLALTCANARATGVQVYTVTFDVDDQATRDLMRNCASAPGKAYFPSSETGLKEAFGEISKNIGQIHLSM